MDTETKDSSFSTLTPEDLLSHALHNASFVDEQHTARHDGTTPTLPPALASMRDKSTTEILASLNKSPLFMTDVEENDELEAFRALAYEGTPLEVASNFKEQGNECFRDKQVKDAREFFSKGVQVLREEERKRIQDAAGVLGEDVDDIAKQKVMLETLLVNRAACELKIMNYRACTGDCISALKLNPRNIKAYYRSAAAQLALGKIVEADDACARGLELDPDNKDLRVVADKIVKKNEELSAKNTQEQKLKWQRDREAHVLRAAMKARNITTRTTAQPPEMEDARIALVPDPLDHRSSLTYPVVILYPLQLQSDFVKDFSELEPIGERLSYILAEPPDWDHAREYRLGNVEIYAETITGGLVKVGLKANFLKVLGGGNVAVTDGLVKIFVVPKSKSQAWIADFKMKRTAGDKR